MNWEPLYPNATYVVLAAGLIGLLIAARRIAVSPKNRRWILFALRAILLASLAILLLNPIERRETVLPPKAPTVAMLVDCSQSMALGVGSARIDLAKKAIDAASRKAQRENQLHVDLYRFGRRLARVPTVAELSATDDASLLPEALDRLPSRLSVQPRAVVLVSDGAVPESEELLETAAAYRDLKVPVFAMLPGKDKLLGDVAITKLAVPRKVSSGDQATIRAVIENHGFSKRRVNVLVRPSDRPNSTPLASLPITLGDGPTSCELVITADPSIREFALEVPILDGEAVSTNNRIPFRLASQSRKIKVLYMEGTAGTEYRWLQNGIQEDSGIQCVSMVVNNQYASRPSLQRVDDRYRGFPSTRKELFEYDVVICSDILRGAFTPEQIEWTSELVLKRGGGFAMVGGHTSFGSGGWDRTRWEELIPFDMTGRRDYITQNFAVQVPSAAESHPIWNLLDDPAKNRAALLAMPSFRGTNLISRVKPAATLLGQSSTPLMRVGVMPVFACETVGRGRTFAMSTDTTMFWGGLFESQWGEGGDNRYFCKFWRNVVRWLAENSNASQKRLIVRTDQLIYSRDEPIEVFAEAYDNAMSVTTDYRVTATLTDAESADSEAGEFESHELMPQPSLKNYVATVSSTLPHSSDDPSKPLQTVILTVRAWDGNEEVAKQKVELHLLHSSKEWLRPQAQPERLRKIAESGGGRLLENEVELNELLQTFQTAPGEVLVHRLPVWDRPLLWLALLGLMAVDWTLRRRGASA